MQIARVNTAMIKSRSKFQFQIPLQFYGTVEKVETCDGYGQKFWQVPTTFTLWLLFCFFMIEIQAYSM